MSFPGRPTYGIPGFATVPGTAIGGPPFNPHMAGGVFVPAAQVGLIPGLPAGSIRTAVPMHIRNSHPMPMPPKPILETPEMEPIDDIAADAPKTTVFVGNISDKAPDVLVRQLLSKCGLVLNWKRVQGASGNLQAFGFCEYRAPENTLRAIRLLHDLTLGDKNLLVKVDAKTRALLDSYLADKNKLKGKESSEEDIDDNTKIEDEKLTTEMQKLIVDYKAALTKPPSVTKPLRQGHLGHLGRMSTYTPYSSVPQSEHRGNREDRKQKEPRDDKIDSLEMEDSKKKIISREIDRFRLTHKDETDRESSKERDGTEGEGKESEERETRKERSGDRERTRDRDHERDRERERERERRKERQRREVEEREREREQRDRMRRDREKRDRPEEDREPPRDDRRRDRERQRTHERDRNKVDEEEEEHDRRKLERKLREKEDAYQERLTNWMAREWKRGRDYSKMKEKEKNEKIEMDKDKRSLHDFLEDYDDEKQDIKYYKGAALEKRREDREKETDADMRDRRREAEEIHEIKRRLKEEGSENLQEELARLEQERDGHKQRRLDHVDLTQLLSRAKEQPKEVLVEVEDEGQIEDDPPEEVEPEREEVQERRERHVQREHRERHAQREHREHRDEREHRDGREHREEREHHVQREQREKHEEQHDDDDEEEQAEEESMEQEPQPPEKPPPQHILKPAFAEVMEEERIPETTSPEPEDETDKEPKKGMGFGGLKLGASSSPSTVSNGKGSKRRQKMTVEQVFNQDEDGGAGGPKKRKLVPIDYTDEEMKAVRDVNNETKVVVTNVAEEKRKSIKSLIEKIPTEKSQLFAYHLDWTIVDTNLMERRIRPWINKKIVEYIGEEEPTLTDFICTKLLEHSGPESILNDITMVLDEEAEVFVVKMWRLLIYEVEAKKHGLVK